jgi:hypothetical protein
MLSVAKHLKARGERPFAAAQGDMDEVNGVTPAGSSKRDSPVMLSVAKHLKADGERPFAAAQGDTVRQLRLMRIGGPINRPLQIFGKARPHGRTA